MASLLDLAQARLGGLLAPPQRPSMVGLLGGQRPQGTLASTIAGYTPPQMQAMSNQQVMDYARTVAQTAQQNLQNQMSDLDKALVMGQQGIQIGDREALARLMEQVPGLMGATAYHGTPHTIRGKFDISKVGTGEGAQSYGHGMYFAEAPQVAETYRRAGGGLEIKYPKPLEELGINPKVVTHSMDWDENPVNQALGRIVKGLRTTALDYPDVPLDKKLVKEHFDEYIRLLEDKYPAEAAQKKALQEFVAKEGYPEIGFGGNLYKVDIPDEYIPNMLDWDKPLSQQNEILKKINPQSLGLSYTKLPNGNHAFVNSEGQTFGMLQKGGTAESFEKNWTEDLMQGTGADFYKKFGQSMFGKDAVKASEALNNAGIKGIRYLDEGSRESGKGTSNFVVFDPTDVKILEKNSQKVEGLLD